MGEEDEKQKAKRYMYGSAPLNPSVVLLNDVVTINNIAFLNQEILFFYLIFFECFDYGDILK